MIFFKNFVNMLPPGIKFVKNVSYRKLRTGTIVLLIDGMNPTSFLLIKLRPSRTVELFT